ncbi:hypothetical protein DFH28DRAFT_1172617 [Melampsora americana]|nr:hypothetical protein DFH28DRAFT_893959 [Melampsora americana]KAH9823275.1 hypothetical protein DFH28DRAFT_1172617 [Melampsora americana]
MAKTPTRKRKNRVTHTKRKTPAPAPPLRANQSTNKNTNRSTNRRHQPAERPDHDNTSSTSSDQSEDSPEDASARLDQDEDDEEDQGQPAKRPRTQTCHPSSNARLNHQITLENYNDLDLDIYTINELLSASGRKTHNRIPSDIQKELKNLQFMYRRSKKLLALAAKCSERTVNEFLEYQNQTKHLSKFSEV